MKPNLEDKAKTALARCDALAEFSEDEGALTRTFLSEPAHGALAAVRGWMEETGVSVRVDAVGNIVGRCEAANKNALVLLVGSHLDTVRDAGRYDGCSACFWVLPPRKRCKTTLSPFT